MTKEECDENTSGGQAPSPPSIKSLNPTSILLLEDSPLDAELIARTLRNGGVECRLTRVDTEEEFRSCLKEFGAFDIVLSDFRIPGFDGLEALSIAKELQPDVPFVFVSGVMGEDVAVDALKQGATDYVLKNRLDRLAIALTRALEESRLRKERADAQHALRETEANFRALADNMDQLAWMSAPNGEVVWFNQRWYNYTGSSPSELANDGYKSFHDPEMLPIAGERWAHSLATGEPFDMEFPLRGADGTYRPFLTRVRPIRNAEGRITRWFGTLTDVGDLRAAQRELSASEELYRATADIIPQILSVHNPDGSLAWTSPGWKKYFGAEHESADKRPQLIHPEDRQATIDKWRECVEKSVSCEVQYRLRRHDGEYRWHNADVRPIFDDAGKIDRWVGSYTDIHDHIALRDALRQSESQYRQIAESLPQIIWTTRPDGYHDFFSSRWYEYTGMPRDGERGWEWSDYLHHDDLERTSAIWQRSLTTGEDYTVEYRFRRHDGEYRWFLGLAKPIRDDAGSIVRWFGSLTDIQEQKEMETELGRRVQERTAELEAANQEMEGFTYSIAHDLRAPLRAIVSTSGILLESLAESLSPQDVNLLGRQVFNATKLAGQIDDLLRYARLGRQSLEPRRIDLTARVLALASDARFQYADRDLVFEVQPGMEVEGDPTTVEMLIENLIDNAAKYSPHGGHVEIGCDDGVYFVRDEGIGIEAQYAERIFRPFERLHRDDEFPGTGVGLANVKRIVERHGGRVWAESDGLGKGTTIRFTLGR
ncbi:PAS domain S-box protein [bacterium]|nr:MAG: PAS domain S-box protein [bacterium]